MYRGLWKFYLQIIDVSLDNDIDVQRYPIGH